MFRGNSNRPILESNAKKPLKKEVCDNPSCLAEGSFAYEERTGAKICTRCGHQADVEQFDNKIDFVDNKAAGKFIFGGRLNLGQGMTADEARRFRLSKAKEKVQQIGDALKLRQDHIDAGKTLYEDAAEINFIQGRTIQSVAAVCLYVTCRLNKLPYLLLDFADAVQTNMFSLGQTYSQLLKKMPWLATKIPLIDPCFFMSRFCTKLDFGTKEKQVRELALRFIGSMNRAWISIGRRPNGLCGAAILIAARVVGFKRSPAQIVRVVHTCEQTIRKRMTEFKHTKMAQLTYDEIKKIPIEQGIDEEMEPPIVRKALCQQIKCSQTELDQYLAILAQKADKMNQKLSLKHGEELGESDSENEENNKQDEVSERQIVMIEEKPMQIMTLQNADYDDEGASNLSDIEVDEAQVDKFICDEAERRLKTNIWNKQNEEYIKKEKDKRREQKLQRKLLKGEQKRQNATGLAGSSDNESENGSASSGEVMKASTKAKTVKRQAHQKRRVQEHQNPQNTAQSALNIRHPGFEWMGEQFGQSILKKQKSQEE